MSVFKVFAEYIKSLKYHNNRDLNGEIVERKKKVIIVKAFPSGRPDSVVLTIPKELREELGYDEGQHFKVRRDGKKIVYEPVE